jgi:hypothetical protein
VAVSVRIEDEAFSDLRYDTLAQLLGLPDADCARGKMATIWRQCTIEGRKVMSTLKVVQALGERGVKALLESGLGLPNRHGVLICGMQERLERVSKLRQAGRLGAKYGKQGGRPRKTPKGVSTNRIRKPLKGLSPKPLRGLLQKPLKGFSPHLDLDLGLDLDLQISKDPDRSTDLAPRVERASAIRAKKPRGRHKPAAPLEGFAPFKDWAYAQWLAAGGAGEWAQAEWVNLHRAWAGYVKHNAGGGDELARASWTDYLADASDFYAGHYPKKWASEPAHWPRKAALLSPKTAGNAIAARDFIADMRSEKGTQ